MQTSQKLFNGFDISWYTKNKTKSFLRKVGSSFGFVIILMPIFGIILSIGNATDVKVLKDIGSILFANIGIWFALAIIMGFTSNKGAAVYAGVISYLVFNGFISAFINDADNKPTFDIWFWNDLSKSAFTSKLFFGGLLTFNSGVIGGILIGSYVTFIYNKLKDINLPKGLEIFAKERFAIIVSFFSTFIFASLFIIIWPLIGFALSSIGSGVAKSPIGLDSFIFRTIQRMLIPFGSSLLWQSPMWYTQVGGSLNDFQQDLLIQYLYRTVDSVDIHLIDQLSLITEKAFGKDGITTLFNNELGANGYNKIEDLVNIWFEQTQSIFDNNYSGDQFIWNAISTNKYITVDDCWNAGLRVSRFISGGFVNSIFVLPVLSGTLLFMTPKGERRNKVGMYVTAGLTAMLVGVTEPVEYLFCYTMPLFYFVIYCPFNGLVSAITSLLHVKVGTSFSTGIFDFALSGIVPTVNGVDTKIWIIPIIGIIAGTLMFVIAYFWIKYFKDKDRNIKVEAIKARDSLQSLLSDFGGFRNILNYKLDNDKLVLEFKHAPQIDKIFSWFNGVERKGNEIEIKYDQDNKQILEIMDLLIKDREIKQKRM